MIGCEDEGAGRKGLDDTKPKAGRMKDGNGNGNEMTMTKEKDFPIQITCWLLSAPLFPKSQFPEKGKGK